MSSAEVLHRSDIVYGVHSNMNTHLNRKLFLAWFFCSSSLYNHLHLSKGWVRCAWNKINHWKTHPCLRYRLWGSSHPCGDGVNNAQTSVLQGKLKLHSCCCEEQQQWHRADHCWPLAGSGSVCAVSTVRVSTLPFFTGAQELLQLSLCPVLCRCFWGENQKSPSSHFDGSQALSCARKASGSKRWEVGMTEYFGFSFH